MISQCLWVPHVGELQKNKMTVKKREPQNVSEHVQEEAFDMSRVKRSKNASIRGLYQTKNTKEQGKFILMQSTIRDPLCGVLEVPISIVGAFVGRFRDGPVSNVYMGSATVPEEDKFSTLSILFRGPYLSQAPGFKPSELHIDIASELEILINPRGVLTITSRDGGF